MQREFRAVAFLMLLGHHYLVLLTLIGVPANGESIEIQHSPEFSNTSPTITSRSRKVETTEQNVAISDDVIEISPTLTKNEDKSSSVKEEVELIKSGMNSFLRIVQASQSSYLDEDLKTEEAADFATRTTTVEPSFQQWIRFSDITRAMANEMFPQLLREMYKLSGHIPDLSDGCMQAMLELVFGLRDEKLWAFQMLDATGKLPSGILVGTGVELGNYDECLAISVKQRSFTGIEEEQFRGSYCRADFRLPIPPIKDPSKITMKTRMFNFENTSMAGTYLEHLASLAHLTYESPMRIGVCVPSTCSRTDVDGIINTVLRQLGIEPVTIAQCDTRENGINLTNSQLAVIGFFSALFLMVVTGTTLEFIFYLTRDKNAKKIPKGRFAQCILCFSGYANTRKLVDTTVTDTKLSSLHGIRVISMAWIVLAHCYLFNNKIVYNTTSRFIEIVDSIPFQAIMNAFILVDTYFFMGALLATYAHLTLLQKTKGRANTFLLLVYRILRLSPTLMFVVAFIFIWPLLSSGPYWPDIVMREVTKCQKNWWTTLLFFNNWMDIYDMCLLHTWYVAADVQLFIIFLFVPLAIFKWPRLGLILNGILCLIGIISAVVMPVLEGVKPVLLYNTPVETQIAYVARRTHFRTYTHLQSYAIGVFLAYIFYKEQKISIKPIYQAAAWVASFSAMLTVLCSTYKWSRGEPMEIFPSILYAGASRFAWSMALSWVVYACATNRAGIINMFLSWSLFVPLGRLCYQIYLIHLLVIWTRFGMLRERLNFSHFEMFCESMVISGISIGAAYVVNLFVEAPFGRLSKLLLSPKSVRSSNGEDGEDTEKTTEKSAAVTQEAPQNIISRL